MRVELVYMQSDSQDLFWCSVLIILEMAGLDFFPYVLRDSKPGFVLNLFLIFLPKPRLLFLQNCSYKKECSIGIQSSLTRVTWVSCSGSIKVLDNCGQSKWFFIFQELYFLLGIFISGPRPWPPQFVFTGPGPRLVFTGPGLQFVFTGPGPQFVFNSPGPEYVFNSPGSKIVFSSPGPKFLFTGPGL